MIIQTVNLNDFRDAFRQAGRADQFSYDGLEALFNYLEEFYSETTWELDVIQLCCDFTEYESLEAFNKEYDERESVDLIEHETLVIRIDADAFIIENF